MIAIGRGPPYIYGRIELSRIYFLGVAMPFYRISAAATVKLDKSPEEDTLALITTADELLDAAQTTEDQAKRSKALSMSKWLVQLYNIKRNKDTLPDF